MTRTPISLLALLGLALVSIGPMACAGSHKHAEVPDFTEKGWSDPAPEFTKGKADPSIQAPVASSAETTGATVETSAPAPATDPMPTAPATKPEASSGSDTADSSTLPFPPPPKATKGAKKKKGKRKG